MYACHFSDEIVGERYFVYAAASNCLVKGCADDLKLYAVCGGLALVEVGKDGVVVDAVGGLNWNDIGDGWCRASILRTARSSISQWTFVTCESMGADFTCESTIVEHFIVQREVWPSEMDERMR